MEHTMRLSALTNSFSLGYTTAAVALALAGCSAGASSGLGSGSFVPASETAHSAPGLPAPARHAFRGVRPDHCAGNKLYFTDYQNSVMDSFGASGGSSACTVTANGLSNPIGIWVQPVGSYSGVIFAANAGNGTAVAYKPPLSSSSVPMWQFNIGSAASDVVQDNSGNVYVAAYGTAKIFVFTPPFSGCSYPAGCSPSFAITDPCGSVYWLATDGKGNVYSNNYCGYVSVFVTPITTGAVGVALSGAAYTQPGGMVVDKRNELVLNDPGTGKINVYGLNPLHYEAGFRFALAPYSGAIAGITLDKSNKFLWGANSPAMAGQRYAFSSGGAGGTPTATDPTLVLPMGAAANPPSND
jgi:hypothetical protein